MIIQRAVEDEFDAWLGRARYERRPESERGLRNYESGLRNGFRSRRVQMLEGELQVEIPQVREAAEPFVSRLFGRGTKLLRTEPLRAMVIGAFVRGLSMRDVESLCEQAGLGKLPESTASRICAELRERFEQFRRRDLYDVRQPPKGRGTPGPAPIRGWGSNARYARVFCACGWQSPGNQHALLGPVRADGEKHRVQEQRRQPDVVEVAALELLKALAQLGADP